MHPYSELNTSFILSLQRTDHRSALPGGVLEYRECVRDILMERYRSLHPSSSEQLYKWERRQKVNDGIIHFVVWWNNFVGLTVFASCVSDPDKFDFGIGWDVVFYRHRGRERTMIDPRKVPWKLPSVTGFSVTLTHWLLALFSSSS